MARQRGADAKRDGGRVKADGRSRSASENLVIGAEDSLIR
jgi:hypothetical protein